MTQTQTLLFIFTSLLVIVTPGQDMILVMSRAIAGGSKAGVITAAGVSIGLLGHTLLTAFGLGSLLVSSKLIFTVFKIIGAIYLTYLGIRLIVSPSVRLDFQQVKPTQLKKLFLVGAFSNISNPKITIFYFAFLPQFISNDLQNPTYLLLLLGISFSLLTFLVKATIGYFAGILSSWLRARPLVLRWIDRTSGAILVGLGTKLAFEKR